MAGYVLFGMFLVWVVRAVYRAMVPRAKRRAVEKRRQKAMAKGAVIVGDVGGQVISLYRPKGKTKEYTL